MLTLIDPQTYSPDEYNIVAIPGDTLRQRAADIQRQLVQILGKVIWLTPPHALHITVMEITGPHTMPVSARAERYSHWQQAYGSVTKEIVADCPIVTLDFNQILVSQRAIILKAANPGPLNEIRAALLAKTKLPEGTNPPPDIAHITLARFSQAVDLDETIERVRRLHIDHTETITEFSLLKDITPPDFRITAIDTYPLTR